MVQSQTVGAISLLSDSLLQARFETLASIIQSEKVLTISKVLKDDELHLVGGAVRDALLGVDSFDLDLATSLKAEEALVRLEKAGLRTIATGLKHGTITVVVDGENIEITTFRAGRSNTKPNTIEADLSGRDFTVNAIAIHCKSGSLVDPEEGVKDLKGNFLRAVGNPIERIKEDPLRMLRAVRFGAAAGRDVDPSLIHAIKESHHLLSGVAIERVKVELEKFLMETFPAAGLDVLRSYGLLPYTFAELIPTIGFEQNRFHTKDVYGHTLDVLAECPPDRILRIAAVYHDIGKAFTLSIDKDGNRHFYEHEKISEEIARREMTKLKFSNDDIDAVGKIVRLHMRPFDCGPSGVRRLLRDVGDQFERWREFKNADRPAVFDDDKLIEMKEHFDALVKAENERVIGSFKSPLAISGDDLKELGFQPGKVMGTILKTLKELILDDPEKNQKETLIEFVRKHFQP